MFDKFRLQINTLIEKIPREKRPIVALACGVLLMILVFFSNGADKKEIVSVDIDEAKSYVDTIEEDLTEVISAIDGAGKTKVMVTLDSSEENIYATDINESKYEYVVIKTSSDEGGLLLKIIQPKIRGVAIVCDGGDSYSVKNEIISAVCSVLDISSTRVSISKMKN